MTWHDSKHNQHPKGRRLQQKHQICSCRGIHINGFHISFFFFPHVYTLTNDLLAMFDEQFLNDLSELFNGFYSLWIRERHKQEDSCLSQSEGRSKRWTENIRDCVPVRRSVPAPDVRSPGVTDLCSVRPFCKDKRRTAQLIKTWLSRSSEVMDFSDFVIKHVLEMCWRWKKSPF